MSRALTVFSRREHQSQYDNSEVERIMAQQGCSEPVAKNLIKYAKLGVGPLANTGQRDPDDDRHGDSRASGSSRDQFPPRLDRKAAAALAEQKLRERQEQEEEDEARLKASQPKKKIGISRLGPVMAREEEVDPYKQASRPAKKREEDENEAEDPGLAIFEARPNRNGPQRNGMGGMFKKPMQIGGISSLVKLGAVAARSSEVDPLEREGPSAFKGEEDDEVDEEEDEVQGDDDKTRQFMDKKRAQDGNKWKAQAPQGGKKKKQRRDREASQSQESEDEARGDAKRSVGHEREGSNREESQASGSLMSEKQVMAMMGKHRKAEGSQRGSVRAKTRILKEREEWEKAKANNPEFWKAPQFALCYSAETGKKARGAG